ncbi:hypothetical protein [Synechococcus sp. CB0205]|uniref:hypothetical protein n=1 Tax=Synechococcus sp. CB0205 TaxID=232363 RepID=UPI0012EAEB31|nr:hypothetical protein [Synechococcus sp. CB0205]
MPYLIIFLVVAVVFYHFWPYILLAAVCASGLLVYVQHSRRENIRTIGEIINTVGDRYKGSYFVGDSRSLHVCQFSDLLILGRPGAEYVAVRFDSIFGDECFSDAVYSGYKSKVEYFNAFKIDSFPAGYSNEGLCMSIDNLFASRDLTRLPSDSLDAKVCSIIYDNLPEAEWADSSLKKIYESIQPLQYAYQVSLTNELLSSNSGMLKRALTALEAEANALTDYGNELYVAIHKCSQFLAIPKQLRNATECDVDTLQISAKKNDMRASFAEVLAIKKEYDDLCI